MKKQVNSTEAALAALSSRMSTVEASGTTFRNLVVEEFRKLGHELDLSSLAQAEAKAVEQFPQLLFQGKRARI